MQLELLHDWMIVELVQEKTSSLVVPDSAKDGLDAVAIQEAASFRVLQAGAGHYENGVFHRMPIKVGDVVVLEGRLSVVKITFKGEDLLLSQGRSVILYERGEDDVS